MNSSDEFAQLYSVLATLAAKNKANPNKEDQVVVNIPLAAPIAKVEPTKVEPNKKVEPTKVEPNKKVEPTKVEPNKKVEPTKVEPNKKVLAKRPIIMDDDDDEEEDEVEAIHVLEPVEPQDRRVLQCKSCLKVCPSEGSLIVHYDKSLPCRTWVFLPEQDKTPPPNKPIHMYMDDFLHDVITGPIENQCIFCKTRFKSTGNHHKHYYNSVACNRLAFYEFKKKWLSDKI
jgi:ferredoxin